MPAGPGRPRKSIEEHKLNGTYRRDRHGPDVPTDDSPPVFPPKPKTLKGRPAEIWDALERVLTGVVRIRDLCTLEELCRWVERAERIDAVLAVMEPTDTAFVKTLTGAAICTDKVLKLSNCFGLSPSDRAKLKPEVASVVKAKVATRPQTRLDKSK